MRVCHPLPKIVGADLNTHGHRAEAVASSSFVQVTWGGSAVGVEAHLQPQAVE